MLTRLQLRDLVMQFKAACGVIDSVSVTSVLVKNEQGQLYVKHDISIGGVVTVDDEPPDEPVYILKDK